MKRILSFLLVMALVCAMLPVQALAATSGTTGSCTWILNDTELTIIGN